MAISPVPTSCAAWAKADNKTKAENEPGLITGDRI